MPWTNVYITQNTDNPNIGDVTAVWNKGLPDEFTFSARGNATQIPAFVAAAKSAQAAFTTKSANLTTVQSNILTALNS
jgi:hypothetical protein